MNVSEQDEFLLNAYVDGELDPVEAVRFERRLGAEPALSDQVKARRALRDTLRSDLGEDVPSPHLRRRIIAKLSPRGPGEWLSWRMAASFLIGAVLAGTMSVGLLNNRPGEDVAYAVVSAHIRALMAPQPTDVASSDHHTVKPFNGKLAFAPTVADLGTQGFPLAGARIDVLGLESVASLVYSHGKHFISLTRRCRTREAHPHPSKAIPSMVISPSPGAMAGLRSGRYPTRQPTSLRASSSYSRPLRPAPDALGALSPALRSR
ncbi:MAG TPA: anti-sigma factor [Methyloceanibacter sp.]|nr:anti-sigma factor [Methyloceanibacter sp.]